MVHEAGKEEQFEEALRAALHGLEPPAGLKERLQTAVRDQAQNASPCDFADELDDQTLRAATSQVFEGSDKLDESSVTVESQDSSTAPPSFTGRRNALVAAMVACVALVAFGLWWNSAPSKDQIVALCLDQAQASDEAAAWEYSELSPELYSTIRTNSSLPFDLGGVAFRKVDAGRLGSEAEIWRLTGSRGEFFVMTLTSKKKVDGLSPALSIVQNGTWCVAAMQRGDQIVIIASVENLSEFIRRQTA